MTVAALPATISYIEDGITTVFAVPYRFKAAGDLLVERIANGIAIPLALGTDYSVTGGDTDAGGTLTRTAATNGATLRITRETARAQPMQYTVGDRFPAISHEQALDRAMLIDQEQDVAIGDLNSRSLMVPLGEASGVLPPAAERAGRAIVGTPDGGFTAAALGDGNDPALRPDLAAQHGSARIGYLQRGLGAVVRTLEDKVREIVSVTDFGAIGDGIANDAPALQKAIDAVFAMGGGVVFIPSGDYKITGTLTGKAGVSIHGQGSLATRLLHPAAGDCIVYGTGTGGGDADFERVSIEGFAVIGSAVSGKAFWGRKATTAFALRDLYIEGGNSPVVLDSCYSLLMENVQVRAAETGHNISINAISHNVTLLQVASQVAKAGAGIAIFGSYTVMILGGKLEFNGRDQLLIGDGCRGVTAFGIYIEGIQPTASDYAGVQIQAVDTVLWLGGFFDATQNGPMGTNGTGTYLKVSGAASRVRIADYGFASIAASQVHVNFGMAADDCEAAVPAQATVVNSMPGRNIILPNRADRQPMIAVNGIGFALTHDARNALTFATKVSDPLIQWDGITFTPKYTGPHKFIGFVQLSGVAANTQVNAILRDITTGTDIAQTVHYFPAGSPSVSFDFVELVQAGHGYQVQIYLLDGAATNRATSSSEASNRLAIERVLY